MTHYVEEETTIHVVEFGDGDVGVGPGMLDDPDKCHGCLLLWDKEPGKIGQVCEPFTDGECHFEEELGTKTKFIFKDIRSVDVLIGALKHVKELMKQ